MAVPLTSSPAPLCGSSVPCAQPLPWPSCHRSGGMYVPSGCEIERAPLRGCHVYAPGRAQAALSKGGLSVRSLSNCTVPVEPAPSGRPWQIAQPAQPMDPPRGDGPAAGPVPRWRGGTLAND